MTCILLRPGTASWGLPTSPIHHHPWIEWIHTAYGAHSLPPSLSLCRRRHAPDRQPYLQGSRLFCLAKVSDYLVSRPDRGQPFNHSFWSQSYFLDAPPPPIFSLPPPYPHLPIRPILPFPVFIRYYFLHSLIRSERPGCRKESPGFHLRGLSIQSITSSFAFFPSPLPSLFLLDSVAAASSLNPSSSSSSSASFFSNPIFLHARLC